jgi:hypothetical protein
MTPSNVSEIEAAARTYTWEFYVQIVLVVVTALLLAFWSWRVWRAENRLQDAIKRDAERQIAEATAEAANANERTATLSLKVEEEARKRAEAEERLALIRERLEPRHMPGTFMVTLKDKAKGKASILYPIQDGEAYLLTMQLYGLLRAAGWTSDFPEPIDLAKHATFSTSEDPWISKIPSTMAAGGQASGISIVANRIPHRSEEGLLNVLTNAFLASGFGVGLGRDENLPDNFFRIIVGPKP